MKKRRKKMLLVLIIALITAITLTALPTSAVSSIRLDDIDYFSEDIPTDKLEQIIKLIYGIDDGAPMLRTSESNPLCWIGLHSIATGTTTSTEHRISLTNPRCRETIRTIEYCTRSNCSHFKVTSERTISISCCP